MIENCKIPVVQELKSEQRKWFGHSKAAGVPAGETPSSPSLALALSFRYLDMISRELEQRERAAEEQRLLQMDREERRQREQTRRKLSLRRKIEEVRRYI